MANLFKLRHNEPISKSGKSYCIDRKINDALSTDEYKTYNVNTTLIGNDKSCKLASYILYYLEVQDYSKVGDENAIYYDNFKTEKKNNLEHTLYFKDIHTKELDKIFVENKWLKKIPNLKSIIKDGFIREIFYWKSLGYYIFGFDNIIDSIAIEDKNDIESMIKALQQEYTKKYLSNAQTAFNTFEYLFANPTYEFAKNCDEIMNKLGFPYPPTQLQDDYKKEIEPYVKNLSKQGYTCKKSLSK